MVVSIASALFFILQGGPLYLVAVLILLIKLDPYFLNSNDILQIIHQAKFILSGTVEENVYWPYN